MPYQANLLKEIERGAVYRLSSTGYFYIVAGFARIQQGRDAEKYVDAVFIYKVEYINIPQSNPDLNLPKVGLRTTFSEQDTPRVRRADDFMDNFFLHERAEKRPKITSVISDTGSEVNLGVKVLEGDKIITAR